MKIYKVKVNGKVFEVELEAVSENAEKIQTETKQEEVVNGTPLKSPMAGTILNVNVNVGDAVKKGDVVCILEAMKLENEVKSGVDGTVKQVLVNKGTQVSKGQVIIVIG